MEKKIIPFLFFLIISSIGFSQSWIWGISEPHSSGVNNTKIVNDFQGNIYTIGAFQDSVTFGETQTIHASSSFYYDTYLAKYDSSSNFQWVTVIKSQANEPIGEVILDHSGNIIIGGNVRNDFIIGTDTVFFEDNHSYVAKFSPAGNLLWLSQIEISNSFETIQGLSTDQFGNIYASTVDDDNFINNTGQLAKFDFDGNPIWNRTFEAKSDAIIIFGDIETDRLGNTYCLVLLEGGYFTYDGRSFFYSTPWWAYQFFILKLDSEGSYQWHVTVNDDGQVGENPSIALDRDQNCYIGGSYFNSAMTIDETVLEGASSGSPKAFLAKVNSAGQWEWAVNSSVIESRPFKLQTDCDNNIYIGGYSSMHSSDRNIWLEKWSPEGSSIWSVEVDGSSHYSQDFDIDGNGYFYFTGQSRVEDVFSDNNLPYISPFMAKFKPSEDVIVRPPTPLVPDLIEIESGDTLPVISAIGENIRWYSDTNLANQLHGGMDYQPSSPLINTQYFVTQTISACESWPAVVDVNILTKTKNELPLEIANCVAFPNPSSAGKVTFDYTNTTAKGGKLKIVDVSGKLVFEKKMENTEGQFRWQENVLSRGIYFYYLEIKGVGNTKIQKLVLW